MGKLLPCCVVIRVLFADHCASYKTDEDPQYAMIVPPGIAFRRLFFQEGDDSELEFGLRIKRFSPQSTCRTLYHVGIVLSDYRVTASVKLSCNTL